MGGGNGLNSLNNFSPISLLGMQLPQSTLPTSTVTPVNGDPRQQALTSPLLLSMIEKIKAAGMNKPTLGDAPLNLSAMLDNNGDLESGEEASMSGELLSWDVVQSTNDPMICRLR